MLEVRYHRRCVGGDENGKREIQWGLPWGWEMRGNVLSQPGKAPSLLKPTQMWGGVGRRTQGWAGGQCQVPEAGSWPPTNGFPPRSMDSSSFSHATPKRFPLPSSGLETHCLSARLSSTVSSSFSRVFHLHYLQSTLPSSLCTNSSMASARCSLLLGPHTRHWDNG